MTYDNWDPDSWQQVTADFPQDGRVVETKIDDGKGVRNITTLYRKNRLWWLPDGSMYVYYTPTHWR